MALGIALLLIFVLYLIDKHNLWRRVAKITAWLVVIVILGIGGFYGWSKYNAHRTEKRQEAENAAYEAKMKPIRDCTARNARFYNAEEQCEKDPTAVLVPRTDQRPVVPEQSVRRPSPMRSVKALQDTDLTTGEIGPLVCGHIKAGEVAALLGTGSYGVRIRTRDGQVGWAYAGFFEVVSASR